METITNKIKKLHNKLFGSRCEIRPGIRYFTEKDFPSLKKDNFEINNKNGFILRGGYYYYGDNKNVDTIIVFCHGYGGGHQAYTKEINYLAKAGFTVLSIDYQGIILSDGDKMNAASQAVSDMDDVLNLIEKDYKHIYAVGHSWGGWVASSIAMLHPKIEKLVMIAGMESNEICIDRFVKKHKLLSRHPFMKIERAIYPQYADLKARDVTKRENLKGLIMQSKDDSILDINEHLRRIERKNKNPNFEFLELDGKNHNPTYTVDAVTKMVKYFNILDKESDLNKIKDMKNKVNWDELCDLDINIMEKIVTFLR